MTIFKRILIPVTADTDEFAALKKAIELSDLDEEIHIHFIDFISKEPWKIFSEWLYFPTSKYSLLRPKGNQAINQSTYTEITKHYPGIIIHTGSIGLRKHTHELLSYIAKHAINLMIVCKNNRPASVFSSDNIDIDTIARLSFCSVLHITGNHSDHKIRSVLIPIGITVPERKIQIAISLAKHSKSFIHIATFLDTTNSDKSKKKAEAFYRTYKILKECGYTPNHTIFERSETDELIIQYSQRVKIDLLILDPARKSVFPHFFSRFLSKPIFPGSSLQILRTCSDSLP